jgi:hypothetical protein
MAGELNNLIAPMYAALDTVSREAVGMIPGVMRDARTDTLPLGQTAFVPVSRKSTAIDIVPSMQLQDVSRAVTDTIEVRITKSKAVPIGWTGVQMEQAQTSGMLDPIMQGELQQAIRAIVNEMEGDLVRAAQLGASRAWGTVGTMPFATNLGDSAQLVKMLTDNGAPPTARSLVIDTAIGASLRTLGQVTKANEAGSTMTLRDGELLNIHGMSIRESAGFSLQPASAGAGYKTNTAGYGVGATSITLTTGTGAIAAGDTVTFDGDPNKYIVKTGITSPGVIVIQQPGLRKAIPASAKDVTLISVAPQAVAYSQDAMLLCTRLPEMPVGGDSASDSKVIVDPRSGIALRLSHYKGFHAATYYVSANWGVACIKPEHCVAMFY